MRALPPTSADRYSMSEGNTVADDTRPDLSGGFPIQELTAHRVVAGRVGDDDVIVVRHADALLAVAGRCTHYGGPLATGLVVGDTIRCPLHHACFSLRTGEALRAPALDALARWRVEQVGDTVYVREQCPATGSTHATSSIERTDHPGSVVIVGAGAAGVAAADMLRREGFRGSLTMLSAESDRPCDRPNLSKDYLAGNASDEWMPLRPAAFYAEHAIDLHLDSRVSSLELSERRVRLESGRCIPFDALLLATGADAVRLDVHGATPSQIHTLRSYADGRAIIAKAGAARRAVVVGASFIGLEVAASLRERGIEVHVVGREKLPMERVLGAELGLSILALHQAHGVVFHLGTTLAQMDDTVAVLSDGSRIAADLVVMGVGIQPAIALAKQAGLVVDRGVVVDEYLQTSAHGVFAAGDIARWPDPHTGERIRVEHWVVAERQGQTVALNILGRRQRFDAVPFFWSQHYDATINYVGHAESWETLEIDGSLDARDCTVTYKRGGRVLAVATISRDLQSLAVERAMELNASVQHPPAASG